MEVPGRQAYLEDQLNASELERRLNALEQMCEAYPHFLKREGTNVNMHMHSFCSYNADEHSPARLVWEARKAGLYAAALCDFDVLDGLREFLLAGQIACMRTAVHLETRAFLEELGSVDINSPGEPGVTYIMGGGFFRIPPEGAAEAAGLAAYRAGARRRNVELVARVNAKLPQIALDYEADVLPLTPGGNATERHIVSAYVNKARDVFVHPDAVARFWGGLLGMGYEETVMLLAARVDLEEKVRGKLLKRGGLGYEQPSSRTFPPVAEFVAWVRSCRAVPMVAWLDGTTGGEADPVRLLETMRDKGCLALNIIPDRNWNLRDPKAAAVKREHLARVIAVAGRMGMPINVGTELNKSGLPFVDDLDGDALRPYREVFLEGARVFVGHTVLALFGGWSYVDEAPLRLSPDRRNRMFAAVGALPALDTAGAAELAQMGPDKARRALLEKAGVAAET